MSSPSSFVDEPNKNQQIINHSISLSMEEKLISSSRMPLSGISFPKEEQKDPTSTGRGTLPATTTTVCGGNMQRSYALGLVFIGLVCIIWAGSSMLVQFVYTQEDEEEEETSPFLMTYVGASLFILMFPMKFYRSSVSMSRVLCPTSVDHACTHGMRMSPFHDPMQELVDDDDLVQLSMSFDQQHHHHHAQQHKSNTTTDADASMMAEELPILYWTNRQHIHAAARIAPVWFLTNFAFNEALALTSISSCMTLASTTSAFAFALEVCLGQAQFHVFKLLGVLFGILGMIFMAIHDSRAQEEGEEFHSVTGDWIALGAAFGYAAYAVQVRVLCPANERYSMKLILGYIGFFILIGLAPIALGVVMTHGGMTGRAFGFAILRGLLDYVLCEYLFFRSVILTSATVASVGLGLTIPLAFLADFILGTDDIISFYSVSGALLVLLGFLAVNLGCNDCEDDSVDESYPVNNNGKAQPLLEKESSLETRKHGNETEKQVL